MKNQRGITLIALVVTIVVLLILAGVSISLILDNNGIIQRSKDAREQYGQARGNEQKQLDKASEWIDDAVGVSNWDKVLEDAEKNPNNYKHPDQSDENGDIGIGTDGKPVNLDLWNYEVINKDEISLSIEELFSLSGIGGYNNSNIIDGEIQGKVPQYIKKDGKDEFYQVTSMKATFAGCDKLVTAPKIPSSVTSMQATFSGCTRLAIAPEIPSSVTRMYYTFSNCTSLTTAPVIPSNVTEMGSAFSKCTKLTGNLIINASPTGYYNCLNNAATADDANLIVSGLSTVLDEIIATKSDNSHITKGN